MPKNDPHSSEPLLEDDGGVSSRSAGRFRDGDHIYDKPKPIGRSGRRVFNKQVIVGLVMLIITFGIGVAVVHTGPDRVWTSPSSSSSSSGSTVGTGDKAAAELPPSNRVMTQKEWQAVEDSKYDPKKFVIGPPTQKYRGKCARLI